MTIRNIDHFVEATADWGPLDDCFPNQIRISDLDGFVHMDPSRNGGRCLFLEAKTPRGKVSRAQEIAFTDMVKQGWCWFAAVWCEAGDVETTSELRVMHLHGGEFTDTGRLKANYDDLRRVCESFIQWASNASEYNRP